MIVESYSINSLPHDKMSIELKVQEQAQPIILEFTDAEFEILLADIEEAINETQD